MPITKTVVFIHGMFENPKSWAEWETMFSAQGYTCYAPAYPYHEGEPSMLREHIDPRLGTLTLGMVTEHIAQFIDTLSEKPVVIGHSMGGLVVQKLVAMGKAAAGICIDTAPPKGITSYRWSFLKSNLPIVNPGKGDEPCVPTLAWFHYAFCNTMSMEDTRDAYDHFVVPESRNVPRSSTKEDGAIDFSAPHAPLLFIAGEKDHIIPSSLNRKNFNAYHAPKSKKEFKEFPGRTHYICAQDGWQEVAQYILNWIPSL